MPGLLCTRLTNFDFVGAFLVVSEVELIGRIRYLSNRATAWILFTFEAPGLADESATSSSGCEKACVIGRSHPVVMF